MIRRSLAVAAAVVAAAAALPATISGAGQAAEITLVSQDAWTALGGDLALGLRAQGAAPGMTLSVVAHQALTSRTAFDRSVGDGRLGSVLDQVKVPLDAASVDFNGDRRLSLGLENPSGESDAARLGVRRAGVYPLAVELRDADDQTVSGFVTYVVAVEASLAGPTPLEQRLGVAWVWPLSTPPGTLPDGQADPAVVAALRPGGRVGRQAAALQRAPDIPLTLVPGPETMQLWASLARDDATLLAGVDGMRDAVARAQVVAGSYVPIDLPSLVASGLTAAVDTQLLHGDETLRRFFGTRADTRTALARPVDAASLARRRAGGVDRVIVDAGAVAPSSNRLTPARPFLLQAPAPLASPVSAVAGDDGLASLLGGDQAPALRAQQVLAGLAVVAVEEPDAARAVVIVNPDSLDVPAATLDAVLTGLRGHPWLNPSTVDDVFENVAPETASNGTATIRNLAGYDPPAAAVTAAAYDGAQARISSFRSLLPADDSRVGGAERGLLSSVSSAWNAPGGAARARGELLAVDAAIAAFLSQIHVPDPTTITLTARSGEIPLTFRNDSGQPVSVLVQLDSQKLAFPDGSSMLVDLPPRSTTLRVPVEARTSGVFPLRLSVRSADGVLRITDTDVRVRATAVSTVGLALMIGAGVFLAVWWGFDIRRRRRARVAPATT